MQTHFDYIILGAGLSGLTTAIRMSRAPFFSQKSIAIIDQNLSKKNDRTWCFWETKPSLYEETVSYSWNSILVKENNISKPIPIAPYTYKKIESADLYAFAKAELSQHKNISFIESEVSSYTENEIGVTVTTTDNSFTCTRLLSSIYNPTILKKQDEAVVLQQHFVGWFVETKEPAFDKSVAIYMDFSVAQEGNCRFMYVLPTTANNALIEYTLFSKDLLPLSEYEDAIKTYLANLGVSDYKITAREKGSIPMTTYDFTQHNSENVLHIGTAGGWTKASTGYTFTHTLEKSAALITFLKSGKPFTQYKLKNRWTFYDEVLLKVLDHKNYLGKEIFTGMFKKGKTGHIFRFLDEESSILDELKVILSAPKIPFIRAALQVLFR
ncbi:lycopene cyclase family protein [Dokdonia sp. Hel_I_53]|uniref:lycopene cyclase family protein n=1 Tax=Dokdonia sp. Hel_I_53 TaxID=1566287 RepID=UPI00119B2B0E|nr:lycopene cyclase family protein [Dokdonia sp. Hel_I_53]TVZ52532.1 lycopene beta-cyclase [Dokdonia sp. Hel_I_53]